MRVPHLPLRDVPLDSLVLWKELISWRHGDDHSRWVFRSPRGNADPLVYKLWNPSYARRENLPRAMAAGLYSPALLPALRALIVHDGHCRGYVMALCQRTRRVTPDLVLELWDRTRASGHFMRQYRQTHVMLCSGRPGLIDVEAAFTIAEYPARRAKGWRLEDPDYEALVARLARRPLSTAEVQAMAEDHIARRRRRDPVSLDRAWSWLGRKANGLQRRLDRQSRVLRPDNRALIEFSRMNLS